MGELAVIPREPITIMEIVRDIASNPQADVGKLEKILDLQERFEKNQARVAFNRAMKNAQEEMDPVRRDAKNESNHSRYARLETIDAAIRPIYTRHGFCLSFSEVPAVRHAENVRLRCNAHHAEGHTEPYELEAPPDIMGPQGKATKTGVQGMGSTVSYLRRYLKLMIFDIALTNEDNDGQRRREPPADEPPLKQGVDLHEDITSNPVPETKAGQRQFTHFEILQSFGGVKKRFQAIKQEPAYYAILAKWGKKKSNEFTEAERDKAIGCGKEMKLTVADLEVACPLVDVLSDPVPLSIGTRCRMGKKVYEVWDDPANGFDWREVK